MGLEVVVSLVLFILRILIGGLFITASVKKLVNIQSFIISVGSYQILPKFIVKPFGTILPVIELLLGFVFFIGWHSKITASLLFILLFAFMMAAIINLGKGRTNIDCGCFGLANQRKLSISLIVQDLALLIIVFLYAKIGGGLISFDYILRYSQDSRSPIILGTILSALVIISSIYLFRLIYYTFLELLRLTQR